MIIFLDFDGVITTAQSWVARDDRIEEAAMDSLKTLLRLRPCSIVVTSTWRLECSLEELRQILFPLQTDVIGVTAVRSNRGEEIVHWLSSNAAGNQFIVIDDEVDEIRAYIDNEHIVEVVDGFTNGGFGRIHIQRAIEAIDGLTR